MICTAATRRQRLRLLGIAQLLVTLIGSACTGCTVGLKPHVEQRMAPPPPREEAHSPPQEEAPPTLATPEAAVQLYVQSIAANDFARALRAYAAHEPATRFDFTSSTRHVALLSPKVQKAPAEYPMFVEINELRAKADMAAATKRFVYGLLTDRDPRGSQPIESDAEIRAFVQAVNPLRLATLRVVRIDQARQLLTDAGEAHVMLKGHATGEGADEVTERIALYELSGQFFWSGFRLCRYDTSWKISEFGAFYGGPSDGGVRKTTAAEYEARVSAELGFEQTHVVDTTAQGVQAPTTRRRGQDETHRCEQSMANESLATPEAAVSLYVERIAANDLTCALRAYAAHEAAARFNFTATASWVQVLNPGVLKAPTEYPMFVEINELRAQAELAEATKLFVYGLLTDVDLTGTQPIQSDAEIRDFVQAVNPARLAKVKVVRIDQPRQSAINSAKAQAHFKAYATREGAEEMTERIALYELAGHLFWSGFRLCRYDKNWKIFELESTYGGPDGGGVGKTTAAEYEARLR